VRRFLLLALTALYLWPIGSYASADFPHLRIKDRRIVDENGSTVILRGVVVNQLGEYFQANPDIKPTVELIEKDFQDMAAIGVNAVRLVITWSTIEPEPDVYNIEYLERIKQAVEWARNNSIYVILDMHQDAWGMYIATPADMKCAWPTTHNVGWDGAPEWATITDGKNPCMIIHREFSPAVYRAWTSFWTNRNGVRDHLVNTWAFLAEAFKDDPAVAGYDLLNEPNWGENILATVLKHKPDFYADCVKAIRQAETAGHNKLIFFEPLAIWSAMPGEMPVKFTGDPDIVYAPHIYLGAISIDMFLFGRELIPLETGFKIAKREAAFHNTTFFNGEYGPSSRDRHGWRYAALEDKYQNHSSLWLWKNGCGDPHHMQGKWPRTDYTPDRVMNSVMKIRCDDLQNPEGVEAGYKEISKLILSRPYPRAFPSPAVFKSDPDTRSFVIKGESPGGVPLVVWIPGDGEPAYQGDGLGEVRLEKVHGGWLLHAIPERGPWSLEAKGRD